MCDGGLGGGEEEEGKECAKVKEEVVEDREEDW